MKTIEGDNNSKRDSLRWRRLGAACAVSAGLLAIIGVVLYNYYFSYQIGVEQPLPFSHRVHALDKQISCLFCHSEAPDSAKAGMPPIQRCLLCHSNVIISHPQIAKLRAHFFDKKPIEWKRVAYTPDFVYFNHSMHLAQQIDCSHCHGDVQAMDRVIEVNQFDMGFCIQCHRDRNVSTACLRCHR